MRIFIFAAVLNLALFLSACGSEETQKKSLNDANESVQIESSDEKSEVNDTNVPLPVEESRTSSGTKSAASAGANANLNSALNSAANSTLNSALNSGESPKTAAVLNSSDNPNTAAASPRGAQALNTNSNAAADSNTAPIKLSAAELSQTQALYESKCAICHGKEGEKKALGNSLIIKDMSQKDFIASLKGYQAGTYGRTLARQMKPAANMLDFTQINALAALIARAN